MVCVSTSAFEHASKDQGDRQGDCPGAERGHASKAPSAETDKGASLSECAALVGKLRQHIGACNGWVSEQVCVGLATSSHSKLLVVAALATLNAVS